MLGAYAVAAACVGWSSYALGKYWWPHGMLMGAVVGGLVAAATLHGSA